MPASGVILYFRVVSLLLSVLSGPSGPLSTRLVRWQNCCTQQRLFPSLCLLKMALSNPQTNRKPTRECWVTWYKTLNNWKKCHIGSVANCFSKWNKASTSVKSSYKLADDIICSFTYSLVVVSVAVRGHMKPYKRCIEKVDVIDLQDVGKFRHLQPTAKLVLRVGPDHCHP